ncbi:hypothetical protein MNBD_ALPHA09-750 [hydrothermal vent metagenome]|uniref:Uncharacterized protein n=1 Tax=hydrothermal vent metagenome TaxID=652676 RepID=A0A3B0T6S1_9ZZZZ
MGHIPAAGHNAGQSATVFIDAAGSRYRPVRVAQQLLEPRLGVKTELPFPIAFGPVSLRRIKTYDTDFFNRTRRPEPNGIAIDNGDVLATRRKPG